MANNNNYSDEAGQKIHTQNINTNLKLCRATNLCPTSGHKGKLVTNQTVKALLKISLRCVQEIDYFFCADQDCPVVYFSADGTQIFKVDQLRERVYQKEPDKADTLICYCFQYTVGILQAGSSQQRLEIVADIKQGTASEQCACDIRNPQGSCCLGNINKLVKKFEAQPLEQSISGEK